MVDHDLPYFSFLYTLPTVDLNFPKFKFNLNLPTVDHDLPYFSLLITTVDHNLPTVDRNLPKVDHILLNLTCHFLVKILSYFLSDMVHELSIGIYLVQQK